MSKLMKSLFFIYLKKKWQIIWVSQNNITYLLKKLFELYQKNFENNEIFPVKPYKNQRDLFFFKIW